MTLSLLSCKNVLKALEKTNLSIMFESNVLTKYNLIIYADK
jgi:hypothetical protein